MATLLTGAGGIPPGAAAAPSMAPGTPIANYTQQWTGPGVVADVGMMFDSNVSWTDLGITAGYPGAPTSGSVTIQAGTQTVPNIPDNPNAPYNAGNFSFAGFAFYDNIGGNYLTFGFLTGKFPLCTTTYTAPTLFMYECAGVGPGTIYTTGRANTPSSGTSGSFPLGAWQPGSSAVTLGWSWNVSAQTLSFTVGGTTVGTYTGIESIAWNSSGVQALTAVVPNAPYWPSANYTFSGYSTSAGTSLIPIYINYWPGRFSWNTSTGGPVNAVWPWTTTVVGPAVEYTGFVTSGLGTATPLVPPSSGTSVFNTPVPGMTSVTAVGSSWATTGGMPYPPGLTAALPPGVQNGDLLLMVITGNTQTALPPDATWTGLGGVTNAYGAYCKYAKGEPATYTMPNPYGQQFTCVILAYRGAQVNAFSGEETGAGTTADPGPPYLTPAIQDCPTSGLVAIVAIQEQIYSGWPATLQTISGPTGESGWNQRVACFNSVDAYTAWDVGPNVSAGVSVSDANAIIAADKVSPSSATQSYLLNYQIYNTSTPPAAMTGWAYFALFTLGPQVPPTRGASGSYVGSAGTDSAQAAVPSLALAVPYWVLAGDLMVLSAAAGIAAPAAPTGWAAIPPAASSFGLYWKIATAADPSSVIPVNFSYPTMAALSLAVYNGPCYPAVTQVTANTSTPGISFSASKPNGVLPTDTLLLYGVAQNTSTSAPIYATGFYTFSSEDLNMPYTAPWTARVLPSGPLTMLGNGQQSLNRSSVCAGMSEAAGSTASLPALTSAMDSYFCAGVLAVRAGINPAQPPPAPATYTAGGTVSGLAAGTLILADSTGTQLSISANGTFTFPTALAAGAAYSVSVAVAPAGQTATITSGSGTIGAANVTSVSVVCAAAATYTVGGTVAGSTGTVGLQNSATGQNVNITGNGTFTFSTGVPAGSGYSVTAPAPPSGQSAAVTNGSGVITNANVTNVAVTCTTTAGGTSHTVGGAVSGLTGTLVLADGDGNQVAVTANGAFNFPAVTTGTVYNVTVVSAPAGQTVTVTGGSGTMGGANITSVLVTCAAAPAFTVGGTVTGLEPGGTIMLQDNGGDGLAVSGNGPFTFATPIPSGGGYNVTILTSPVGQAATISNGAGTVGSANITNVTVICAPAGTSPSTGVPGDFTIGGELILGGGTTTAANAPVLVPALTAGTAAQLADTSRDYQCYFQTSASGTFSLAIGPTSTPASVVFASASLASAELVSFRLPAGWFVLFAGTATLTQQRAIGC